MAPEKYERVGQAVPDAIRPLRVYRVEMSRVYSFPRNREHNSCLINQRAAPIRHMERLSTVGLRHGLTDRLRDRISGFQAGIEKVRLPFLSDKT